MKSTVGTLTTDLLEHCANWFLYIFIAPDAGLSKEIMNKRAKQIEILHIIDGFALFNTYQNLVTAVETGIRKKYGLSPVQVLSVIYNIKTGPAVGDVFTGTYFDGEKWVDGDTGAVLPEDQQVSATKVAQQINNSKSDFWTGFKDVIDWLVELIAKLGLTKKQTDFTPGTATLSDWNNVQESSMSGTIPYIVGGVVLYYLFTRVKK